MSHLRPFALERFFAKHEFAVEHLLCASDCESFSIKNLLALEDGASERFLDLGLGYIEASGSQELRLEISELYTEIIPDEILCHSGAQEAIFAFAHAMFNPGDHVIVHSPCYQSLTEVARSIGCEVSLWETRHENGWELDTAALRAMVRPNTKAIIINAPHNPTGYLPSKATQAEIVEIARQNGTFLFSDEVYRGLEHRLEDQLPAIADIYEKGISLGVMSKAFGLAGLRIGWVATRELSILKRMAEIKDYLTICNSAPSELLAAIALRQRDLLIGRNRELAIANLKVLNAFFEKHSRHFDWKAPRAGVIAFPKYTGPLEPARFFNELLAQSGVLLLPGDRYGADPRHFRIGFGRKSFAAGMTAFEQFMTRRN